MAKNKNKDVKQYFLSREEQTQLNARRNLGAYLIELVERDILTYVDEVVKPRLGLPKQVPATLNEDMKSIIISTDASNVKVEYGPEEQRPPQDAEVAGREPRTVAPDKKTQLPQK